ncbi:MAG: sensor histidine kinase [Geodermatophilaceae bacterium]|nr:sensor histidine kinase [Geodermatophilaceae bacterium]
MAQPSSRPDGALSRWLRWSADRGWGGGLWPHTSGGPWAHAPGEPGRRSAMLHALFAVAAAVGMSLGTRGTGRYQTDRVDVDALAFILIAGMALGLFFRRTAPLAGFAITTGATALYFGVGYPAGPAFFAICFLMVEVALWLPTRTSLIACSFAVVTVIGSEAIGRIVDGGSLSGFAPYLGWLLVPWAVGAVKRAWQESRTQQQSEQAQQRRYEERLAVVREVHDVVGHGLAVINMQAGVALHVLDRRPEQAEIALTAIKRASKDSLDELRATLAVFRHADGAAPLRPMPGLGDLPDLVSSVRVGGLTAELSITGRPRAAPSSVDLAAYRIVQESLTNVVRHARATYVTVTVDYQQDAISVLVVDDGMGPMPGPDAGQGVIGMRERATSLGGRLSAGRGANGGFVVDAWLPLPEHDSGPDREPLPAASPRPNDLAAEHVSGRSR